MNDTVIDGDAGARLEGRYFDGKTSRAHIVTLHVQDRCLWLSGDVERICALDSLQVSERSTHALRKITFPDDAYLEVRDQAGLNAMLHESGHRDGQVVRMQRSWRGIVFALASTVVVLVLGYMYGLPTVAKAIAYFVPQSAERKLGDGIMTFLDGRVFSPSELTPARQAQLIAQFGQLAPPRAGAPTYHILFRKSKIGPNAFALPSGEIVMTDEMVKALNDDEAVAAVFAHELGHLHERHLTRRIIQSSVVAAGATLLFGDVSSVVANVPTVLLDLKYSRDVEREADDYALAMLKTNHISSDHMARVFEVLGKLDKGDNAWLSSHPASSERIAHIRGAR